MSQPIWRKVGAVGDVNPVDYGGGFVFVDETGVYDPEVEYYLADNDDDNAMVSVYRFIAEPCTYHNGILSDNEYHPDAPVWFADDLPDGVTPQMFCGDNVMQRSCAWLAVAEYHGFDNLDNDPLRMSRQEAEQRASR